MLRIDNWTRFVNGLMPFVLRKGKSLSFLMNQLLRRMMNDISAGQQTTKELLDAGNLLGQHQVMAEELRRRFGAELIDGSDGNVVLFGEEKPYIRLVGGGIGLLVLPMENTSVGEDFVVEVEDEQTAEMVSEWLDSYVFAGVGYVVRVRE